MSEGAVDPRVQAALLRAEELEGSPPEEHVAVYEDVHNTLQQVLAEAGGPQADELNQWDETPGVPVPPPADAAQEADVRPAGGDAAT